MSLGWKTLLRAICISAFATVMVSMPAHAARKNSHSAPSTAAKQVSARSAKSNVSSGKVKSTQRSVREQHKETRNSHKKESSQDRRYSRKADGRSSTRESGRSRPHHEPVLSSERRERRYNRYSRRRGRRYGYHSDFSGADYVGNMTSDVVSKPSHPHGYTARATDVAMTAMSLIGTPYRYGGNSPLTGLDCSGFVKYVYKETMDTDLPRTAAEMSRVGKPVSQDDLQPGDLVFYNTMRRNNSHVGIYLGDGRFIHSPRTGQRVRINSMDESYWRGRFNGARRIIGRQGIDRAKALQQYSREADTSPDTYNYDANDELSGKQQSSRYIADRRTERTLTNVQKPSRDVVVRETAVQEPSYSSEREVHYENRSQHKSIRHQERVSKRHRDAAKETIGNNSSKQRQKTKHSRKTENHHKEDSSRRSSAGRNHRSREDAHHHRKDGEQVPKKSKESRHQKIKADKHDVRHARKEQTADRKNTDKAKTVKRIERKSAIKEKTKRRR